MVDKRLQKEIVELERLNEYIGIKMLTKEWAEEHIALGRTIIAFQDWSFAKNKRGYHIIRGYDVASDRNAYCRVEKISEILIDSKCVYALINDTLLLCKFEDHSENLSDLKAFFPYYKQKLNSSSVSVERLFEQISTEVISKVQKRKDLLESCISAEDKAVIFSLDSSKEAFADFFSIKNDETFIYCDFKINGNRIGAYYNNKLYLACSTRNVPAKKRFEPAKNYVKVESLLVPSEQTAYIYNAGTSPLHVIVNAKTFPLYEGDLFKLK